MSKCSVRVVRKRSAGSYRLAATAGATWNSSAARSRPLLPGRAIHIFQEREVRDGGQPDPMDVRLEHGHVGLVPQADVGHVARDGLLNLAVQQRPLGVVG